LSAVSALKINTRKLHVPANIAQQHVAECCMFSTSIYLPFQSQNSRLCIEPLICLSNSFEGLNFLALTTT